MDVPQQTRTQRLAAALLTDRDKQAPDRTDIIKCFMCGCSMMYRGSRFCSDRCRDSYDSGKPAYEQDWRQPSNPEHAPMAGLKVIAASPGIEVGSGYYVAPFGQVPVTPTRNGFKIKCAGCDREFESLGLKHCSTECIRRDRERQENRKVLADAGIEIAPKKRCEVCGTVIPKFRNGRAVSSKTRFCSPKCSNKARKALQS
jgi:hypothetical protein